MDLVLATSNAGKAQEIRAILEGAGHAVHAPPLFIGDIETGTSYLENALIKAESVGRLVHTAVIAEDTGLEVDALGGLPGLHSARFAGPAARSDDNIEKLLRLMDGVGDDARGARYRIVAVVVLPSGRRIVGEGTLEGRITRERRGDGGFGYDPVFVPSGEARTIAEMGADEKNAISHRARALRELLPRL